MSTAQLIAVDQILSVLVVAVWGAAAGFCTAVIRRPGIRRTALIATALVAAAILATGARVATAIALATAGWWFAAEKITVALPLTVVPALATAVVTLPRLQRGREPAALPPFAAAYGALAGVLATTVMSYPVTAAGVTGIVALFAGACAITWAVLTGRRLDRTRVAGVAVLALALVWALAGSWSGGGTVHAGHGVAAAGVPVSRLLGPSAPDAKRFTLTAREAAVRLPSGLSAAAWAFNGQVPGPTLRVRQGDLVEVTLRNELPDEGVTIHWHGYDVPSGEDGVPGVTQNAVKPGETHVYRFRAAQAGTYWYHSHQDPSVAVPRGLFGLLVVDPAEPIEQDHTVALHTFAGKLTMSLDGAGPSDELIPASIPPGGPVRLRIVNTDSVSRTIGLAGVPYTLAAVDGTDVPGATALSGQRLSLAAGGRYDLAFTMPSGPVRLHVDGHPGLLAGGPAPLPPPAGPILDITRYGTATAAPTRFDKNVTWVLDQDVAFSGGLPKLAQTVNGKAWPNIPTPTVRRGETIEITVVNRGREDHPMHPHGHHVRILSRNGHPANGLWMDTFDVAPGEVWVVALKADNPGMWMSHCHDLAHAARGMEFHLAYEGITTPFDVTEANHPA
ncbi:multicopper oxidase family protein [Streptosporangiaceae bacterium NEAU-GS5]|nr:multicopper oxidase family protein [Streptosporangiaceae bacterium NEAU-GS5]